MEKIKCTKCGKTFEGTGAYDICPDCKRKNHTKSYLTVAIIILIIGTILGFVLGGVYEKSTSLYTKEFNSALMLYTWMVTAVLDIFIFAIHSICYRLDLIIDKK